MSYIEKIDPELYQIIQREHKREHNTLELIASENFVSRAILEASGGIISTWDGSKIGNNDTVIACNNKNIHRILVNTLQKYI